MVKRPQRLVSRAPPRFRTYGHSDQVGDQSGEPDEACEIRGLFFVPGRNASAPFDAAEEPLNLISVFVGFSVISLFSFSSRIGFDAYLRFETFGSITNGIGVVGCIGDHSTNLTSLKRFQQMLAQRGIASLAGSEDEVDQLPRFAGHGMDFRG